MNKSGSLARIVNSAKLTLSKHSPEILMSVGIAGMITTTVLAVKATPKAVELIQNKKKEENKEKLTAIETIKTTWKCYIPAATTGLFSIGCLIGSNSVHARRNAAIATAYKLSETALSDYREKVIETIGEKKEKVIQEKIDKERIEKNPVSKSEVIITKSGDKLCYDVISGRYFKSDIDKIEKVVNELNRRMLVDMYVSLNEFYDELGLTDIKLGDDLGWNIDSGLIDVYFTSQITDEGELCMVLNYNLTPKYGYSKFA